MNKLSRLVVYFAVSLMAVGFVVSAAQESRPPESPLAKDVRAKLERLGGYGVFDILTYRVDQDGTVELGGSVFNPALRKEAEEAVRSVAGVSRIVNGIESLRTGVLDDEIRAKVYLNIYRDSSLARYGTALDMARASGAGFRGRIGRAGWLGAYSPYLTPGADYAIHIVVSRGEVILAGNVDSDADRNLAELKARTVPEVRRVVNQLTVRNVSAEPEPTPRD